MILIAEGADAGKRLDSFVHERLPKFSRSRVQSWIKEKLVLVNGAASRASALLRGNETISVEPAELEPLKAQPEDIGLSILYEDADVIVDRQTCGHGGARRRGA